MEMRFHSSIACSSITLKLIRWPPLILRTGSGILSSSDDGWCFCASELHQLVISCGFHSVLSLVSSVARFGCDGSVNSFYLTLVLFEEIACRGLPFVIKCVSEAQCYPFPFPIFFSPLKPGQRFWDKMWMQMYFPHDYMILLERCMHCWILPTHDKYQKRLSWISARKLISQGHRINKENFQKKNMKINIEKHTGFLIQHTLTLSELLPYSVSFSQWHGAISSPSSDLNGATCAQ